MWRLVLQLFSSACNSEIITILFSNWNLPIKELFFIKEQLSKYYLSIVFQCCSPSHKWSYLSKPSLTSLYLLPYCKMWSLTFSSQNIWDNSKGRLTSWLCLLGHFRWQLSNINFSFSVSEFPEHQKMRWYFLLCFHKPYGSKIRIAPTLWEAVTPQLIRSILNCVIWRDLLSNDGQQGFTFPSFCSRGNKFELWKASL